MLDLVAKRYGMLPSQTLSLGNSIDVKCALLALDYENYQHKKHQGGWKDHSDHGYNQDQLQAMVERAKNENKSNQK
jgi:hypothetical protein|tara:strand:+ start:871 stop:1098 length:228 start_codon:yes stop_codon:yes gene_type:complete